MDNLNDRQDRLSAQLQQSSEGSSDSRHEEISETINGISKPKLKGFGLTKKEYDAEPRKVKKEKENGKFLIGIALILPVFPTLALPEAIFNGDEISIIIFLILSSISIVLFYFGLIPYIWTERPKLQKIKEYEQAKHKFEQEKQKSEQEKKEHEKHLKRMRREWWFELSGYAFEQEMAKLFEKMGCRAQVTSGSGDGGVDIYVAMEDGTAAVQCKAHRRPVGPAVVRELFGVVAGEPQINQGILVALSGASSGAHSFVEGKPLTIWALDEILEMQNRFGNKQ